MASNGGSSAAVDDLPPSARYVLHILEEHGELTRQDLLEETGLPERTLQDALERLDNRNSIHKSRKSDDLTQVVCEYRGSPNS
jgi:transcription initiation factor IIE alpha subunit